MRKEKIISLPTVTRYFLSKILTDYNKWAILGDLEEEYHDILSEKGKISANWFYVKYSVKTIPKSIIHRNLLGGNNVQELF